ncbi:MAG TPA: tetratricopeptide repeat protein, partial [Thermoanaerobaculia bacterium]|nr:tetratricopeptide repeat protein [Thermoanaerobaculia bacterium]
GDMTGSLEAYERARTLLAGNDEAAFWAAILMAGAGRVDEARELLAEITSREPGWRDLLLRLPAAGLLTDGDSTLATLLGS